jgi:hypothetical protein
MIGGQKDSSNQKIKTTEGGSERPATSEEGTAITITQDGGLKER